MAEILILELKKEELEGDVVYDAGEWYSFLEIDDDGDVKYDDGGGFSYIPKPSTVITKRPDIVLVLKEIIAEWTTAPSASDDEDAEDLARRILEAGEFIPKVSN